ncbi:MAG: MBL fold metallo-hydrolase [Cyanobacteria bacterium J06642_11]
MVNTNWNSNRKKVSRTFLRVGAGAIATLILAGIASSYANDVSVSNGQTSTVNTSASAPEGFDNAYTVRTYASPDPDSVNSHLIETPNGVVVISAQRLFSEADRAIARINRLGKPVLTIVVTVPHTDHFGGLTRWREAFPDAEIYAAEATVESMRTDSGGYIASRKEAIGDDFPSQEQVNAVLPNEIVEDGDEITVDGLTLRFINLPNNNAPMNTLVYLPEQDVLFSSEVVEDSITVFLKEADLDNWLQQLNLLEDRFTDTTIAYPAHGTPGPLQSLIAEARTHLTLYRDGIDEALTDDQIMDEAETAALVSEVETAYPDYTAVARLPREQLVSLNIQWQAEKRASAN